MHRLLARSVRFLRHIPIALSLLAGFTAMPALAVPVETTAPFAYVVEFDTGAVLYDKRGTEQFGPASMSKLMTAYMLFDALKRGDLKMSDTFHVSEKAWSTQGSKMFVDINTAVAIEDLIRGIVIQSGNDACIVVAEGMAGSEEAFAERMNKKAQEIGLTDSNFVNASGWPDPNHRMTAKDLATLARRLISDFPEYYHFYSEREFTYHGIKQGNRNPLLYRTGSGVDGLKTGHTEEAGYGLTASAIRDGRRVIMVLHGMTGMQERADQTGIVLDWAFREFGNYTIAAPGTVLGEAPVWMGAEKTVPLTVESGFLVTLPRAERQNIVARAVFNGPIAAPIAAGQQIGELVVDIPGMPQARAPLVAGKAVGELGFGGRIAAALSHFIFGSS
ncbi:D-alanyl-D-alanine carboxypeptidase (penicillin-binding protein 5/6) [Dongia mobilis]|uniref:serine-type D-Ala-D-Ala carboxypeptidase n=1 Tax=Dongia mobilis TaxID=578943 RepID=A0A4R6WSB4_9PROT|nr:D-alanyl-D-alanine carboxypeptidase family protein [Dongia mobilis]TDQ81503.1 D-alanyl-D-alanine carboxypeptidase (penicillin-binding protein 5/6) [Dongia mobilis]